MIFKPELITKILDGQKTVTRRPRNGKPSQYVPGRTYALQPGRGKKAVGRIKVLAVTKDVLRELTYEEAQAEGFGTPHAFQSYWELLYGEYRWHMPVWVIDFELVEP